MSMLTRVLFRYLEKDVKETIKNQQVVEIREITKRDVQEVYDLLAFVMKDNFIKEGIENHGLIEEEMGFKKGLLEKVADNKEPEHLGYLASHGDKVVGCIIYGVPSGFIIELTNGDLNEVGEIGSLYILPSYQRQGIGTGLLKQMLEELQKQNIKEYCLDSGYHIAKKVWKKLLGAPAYILKDYWEQGKDHHVWYCSVTETLKAVGQEPYKLLTRTKKEGDFQ